MRAEGFFCNLDVLYGVLGIDKFFVFDSKKLIFFSCKFFSAVNFFLPFMVIKPLDPDWIRIRFGTGIQPKMLDPDDADQMNADPQP